MGGEDMNEMIPAESDDENSSRLEVAGADATELLERFREVRKTTVELCSSLEIEDYVVQSMPDASPAKWHLAHTTWFFETFILSRRADAQAFDPAFREVFNSYYEQIGEQFTRERRGTLSRPTVKDVLDYRSYVDEKIERAFAGGTIGDDDSRMVLGLNHEQQHQELLLTDVKHALGQWAKPGFPMGAPYCSTPLPKALPAKAGYSSFDGGVVSIGHHPDDGFAFDSETPRHQSLVLPFKIACDVVRNRDFLAFIDDGGYQNSALWLSDGWDWVESNNIQAPLYWSTEEGADSSAKQWWVFTLHGLVLLDLDAPVVHVSFFEADAFARWAQARLPTEQEWELAATTSRRNPGAFLEDPHFHPMGVQQPAHDDTSINGLTGDVWEWTQSAYLPYPGFKPLPGALGEYNGKFMNGQRVLRGGSVATPRDHIRATYRNFFQPEKRWQMTGIRLAKHGA